MIDLIINSEIQMIYYFAKYFLKVFLQLKTKNFKVNKKLTVLYKFFH